MERRCKRCGEWVGAKPPICRKCGGDLEESMSTRARVWMIVCLGLGIIFIFLTIVIVFFSDPFYGGQVIIFILFLLFIIFIKSGLFTLGYKRAIFLYPFIKLE